jgi:hypothetical protein
MAKQKSGNYVALELQALEKKIKQFREYLDNTSIKTIQEYEERHAEIKVQLLLMKELINILSQFDSLKKQSEKDDDDKQHDPTRGDIPLSPLEEGLI